ncbi:hypothetical protein CAPTEDRAFT_227574 [Capitella teleta]|uniref:Oxysterol-binding protein n=1 Tax=Capitella teleta TaxID=283909 RepID=R7TKH4_CAPTE|nr:hypothetical protein CAPTEDRAFT_227574 [Capitella teleta]|eukprot:ELT92046.1 hypothetical protein CAPTEDRAFT_227574 [Capitella teleta]
MENSSKSKGRKSWLRKSHGASKSSGNIAVRSATPRKSSDSTDDGQPLEGLLYKYTNVMKGWQYRWFTLDPESGRLDYFEKEEHKRLQRPRGSIHLAGAVMSPSDEDSQTFTVNAANGEIYKLKAFDAKERQHWVNRLRATAEHHNDNIAMCAPPILRDSRSTSQHANKKSLSGSSDSLQSNTGPAAKEALRDRSTSPTLSSEPMKTPKSNLNKSSVTRADRSSVVITKRSQHKLSSISLDRDSAPLANARGMIVDAHTEQMLMAGKIEELPNSGGDITALDKEMLLLKATSNATLVCLEQCLSMLQQQQAAANQSIGSQVDGSIEWLDPKFSSVNHGPVSPAESFVSAASVADTFAPLVDSTGKGAHINHEEEVQDEQEYSDTELGAVEEHKSIILHLLSQLKLGMDLTKVVLPTFILEKRSLLELFADCMAHPDIFLRITEASDPEARMHAVLEWYLTSFHAGRKGSIAKKPYNPIIGETFHCSWNIPKTTSNGESQELRKLFYCAEQVSHHPPISAFYFECPESKVCMNASIWTKSKFMGMSIGVVMVGKLKLKLLEFDEEYEFSLPSAYARSILTVPWVELGDRVTINCFNTNYSSSVIFHTKPFYGGKLHKVNAEVKNPSGDVTCRVSGTWNDILEFNYADGSSKEIDTKQLKTCCKWVRPIASQGEFESRKLWTNVTEALKNGNIEEATQHKRFLEENQRRGERHRKETNTAFPTKYFHKKDDSWLYNEMLSDLP